MTTSPRIPHAPAPRLVGVLAAFAGLLVAPGAPSAQGTEPETAAAALAEATPESSAEQVRAALAGAVAEARAATEAGIPFRLAARLAALDALSAALDQGKHAEVLDGLWTFLEYEVARAGSNELARQEVTLEGQAVPAEVVRLGLVELFFRAGDGRVGRGAGGARGPIYEEVRDEAGAAALGRLFDRFGAAERTGLHLVPVAAVPSAPPPPGGAAAPDPGAGGSTPLPAADRAALEKGFGRVRATLKTWGIRCPEGLPPHTFALETARLGLAGLARASRVSDGPGAFLAPDGTQVRGRAVRYGLVAAFGISEQATGALAPTEAGPFQVAEGDTAAATLALAAGAPLALTPLVLTEPLGPPPGDLADPVVAPAAPAAGPPEAMAAAADVVEVTAARAPSRTLALLQEKQESGAVAEVMGAEQIARSGDSNAAEALKRATGLTVVGGQFVYVRGLGERYVSTSLDGSALPSPDPERRVVPLDMFPAGVVDSLFVGKSYLPEEPGEFGGGSVRIRTLAFPTGPLLKVSARMGFRPGTTFAQGLTYQGGGLDWLGVDDGARALPDSVAAASADQPLLQRDMFSDRGYTAEELEAFGEAMPNVWATGRSTVLPAGSVGLALGNQFRLGERGRLGVVAALGYSKSFQRLLEDRVYYNLGSGGALEPFHTYAFESLTDRTVAGGLLNVSLGAGDAHVVGNRLFLNHVGDDETRVFSGYNRDAATDIEMTRLRFVERTLLSDQVSGHHIFPVAGGLVGDWRFTYSRALRHEPDTREYRYDFERVDENTGEELWLLSDRPEGNSRLYSDLVDNHYDAGLDVKLLFPQWSGLFASVGAGVNLVWRDREVGTRRYKFQHRGGVSRDSEVISQRNPEDVFTPENIGPGDFQFEEFTQQTDNYTAEQQIRAVYLATDFPLHDRVRLVGGARVEGSRQVVSTYELFNPESEPVVAEVEDTEVLFGADLVLRVRDDMNVRLAGARTVNRPDFRELSPATFNDVTGGRQVYGNPDLRSAVIYHADARWEWYPKPGELISVGAFYKRLWWPIETVVVVSAQLSVTYANADHADNVGVEMEVRKRFDFIHPKLAPLSLAFNAAWIGSRVRLPEGSGVQTSNDRPLQGQSPFVVNVALGYDGERSGTQVNLLYNVFGARIAEVGADGAPDVYEQPVHQLDLSLRQELGRGFALTFDAQNLVDPEVRFTQGGETVSTHRRGRTFTVGARFGI